MARTINPIRKRIVKRELKKGNDAKNSMIEAGYSINTAIKSTANKVVQVSQAEIKREFDKSKLTVEWVLDNLEQLRIKAETKKDYGTAKGILELIGKWKRMWDEKSITQVNVYSQTPEDKKSLADIKNRIHTIPDKVESVVSDDTIEPDTPKDSDDKEL